MTEKKWEKFDETLQKKLIDSSEDMRVEVSQRGLTEHLDKMSNCMLETIKEVVPPKKRLKFDGRKASAQTRALYTQRIRDFSTKRAKILKSERKAWNTVLNRAAKRDYHDWVARWIKKIEAADNVGDVKLVHQGANTLSGKSRKKFTKQPTRNKKRKR